MSENKDTANPPVENTGTLLFAVVTNLIVWTSILVACRFPNFSLRNPACLKTFSKKEPNVPKHCKWGPTKSLLYHTRERPVRCVNTILPDTFHLKIQQIRFYLVGFTCICWNITVFKKHSVNAENYIDPILGNITSKRMYFKLYCVIFLAEFNFSAFQISKEGIGEIHRRSFHCRRNLDGRQIDVVDLAKKRSAEL